MSDYTVGGILHVLNRAQRRATYQAVGALTGIHPQSVSAQLGMRRPEVSWVVSKLTGMPTDFEPEDLHPQLQNQPRVNEDPAELITLMGGRP